MKKIISSVALAIAISGIPSISFADEKSELYALVKEIDYLIEVSQQMQKHYGNSNQRVRFNYSALIKQLKTTRNRTAEYFNTKGETIHPRPPLALDQDLIRIK